MKAAQINEYGKQDVIKVVTDAAKPVPKPDQVLITVHAASINPFDWKLCQGFMQQMAPLSFPATLGGDVAGKVAEIGEAVTDIKVGDEVYGQANPLSGHGSFAEFTAVSSAALAPKPASVDFVAAAALPLVASSAYQALVDHAKLKEGQKVLIHGGAGGIGSVAIQIAKHIGAYVATTATNDGVEFAKELGADEVIDYKTQDFTKLITDYDVVYDTVGGKTFDSSFAVLKAGGVIVSMVEQAKDEQLQNYNVTAISQSTKVTTERLTKVAELIDSRAIKAHVDKVFPLQEIADAFAYLDTGKQHGKIVVKIT